MKSKPDSRLYCSLEKIKTLLIFILFICLILMCFAYVNIRYKNLAVSIPKFEDNYKMVISKNTGGSNLNNSDLISPVFIGISSGKSKKACSYDNGTNYAVWSDIKQYAAELFQNPGTIMEFSDELSRTSYINNILSGYDYIFFTFGNDIPAQCFVPFILNKPSVVQNPFYVRSLIMSVDKNNTLFGIAIDSDGNIAQLYSSDKTSVTNEKLYAYTNIAQMPNFEIQYVNGVPVPVFSETIYINTAKISSFSEILNENNAEIVSDILKSFSFNPNNTKFYTALDGSVTYVENEGDITITKNGEITFASLPSSGIPIYDILKSQNHTYSFSDKLFASEQILSGLCNFYFTKDAKITLDTCTYDDGILSVNFIYTISGIPVSKEFGYAKFDFDDSSIVGAKIYPLIAEISDKKTSDVPQNLMLALIKDSLSGKGAYSFLPKYSDYENDGSSIQAYFAVDAK